MIEKTKFEIIREFVLEHGYTTDNYDTDIYMKEYEKYSLRLIVLRTQPRWWLWYKYSDEFESCTVRKKFDGEEGAIPFPKSTRDKQFKYFKAIDLETACDIDPELRLFVIFNLDLFV